MNAKHILCFGLLTSALAGCIGRHDHTHDSSSNSSADVSSAETSSIDASSAASSTPPASSIGNSSADSSVAVSSLTPMSSSMAPISSVGNSSVETSSSASSIIVPMSSSSVVVASSSVAVSSSSVISSSEAPSSSSSVAPSSSSIAMSSSSVVTSSSAPMVKIEDVNFEATLDTDQDIQTDSIANLGAALIGLIDPEAYAEFNNNLVALGLDQNAVAHAMAPLSKIGSAIGAHLALNIAGQALLPTPEGVNLEADIVETLFVETRFNYKLNQIIDDVEVVMDIALSFPTKPAANISPQSELESIVTVPLRDFKIFINTLSMKNEQASLNFGPATPDLPIFAGNLQAQFLATSDLSNIFGATIVGQGLSLNFKANIVNGIIGVDASAVGSMGGINATIDLTTGSSVLSITEPDLNINMQAIDTSGN